MTTPLPPGAEETAAPRDAFDVLQASPLFAGAPAAALWSLAAVADYREFPAGHVLIREGAPAAECFLLSYGRVEVTSLDLTGNAVVLATLHPGACFGEQALVAGGVRTASVAAASPVGVFTLTRAQLLAHPVVLHAVALTLPQHADLLALDAFLRRASPFAHLPGPALRRVVRQMQPVQAPAGTVLLREGDDGTHLYLIRSGRVEVTREGRQLRVLQTGDCFGEVALLAGTPVTADVQALDDCDLLALDRAAFLAVAEEQPSVLQRFQSFVRVRMGGEFAGRALGAADPFTALMPAWQWRSGRSFIWVLALGLAAFVAASFFALRTLAPEWIYAALAVGAFVGPVVFVTYMAEQHLLPDRPVRLAVTFVLAAALGIPVALYAERALGASTGALGPALLVAVIEEPAKLLGLVWLLRGAGGARYRMDGVMYGAAAGMGFAAFETLLYGYFQVQSPSVLLSTLWLRAVFSPFGHGTWTAIVGAALWRDGGRRFDWRTLAALGLAVGLHTLWDWQPVRGFSLLMWLVAVGAVGVVALRWVVGAAQREALRVVVSLNPELAQPGADGREALACDACGQVSPPGVRYCPRCGNALHA